MMKREPTEMELRCAEAFRTADVNMGIDGARLSCVRAVIRAMREPTKEMLDAAVQALTEPDTFDLDAFPDQIPVAAALAWKAMIDAASPPE